MIERGPLASSNIRHFRRKAFAKPEASVVSKNYPLSPTEPAPIKRSVKMPAPDIKADAQRVFDVIKGGGIAITPMALGYSLATTSTKGLEKMFTTKKRPAHKRHAMGGNYALHKELHLMEPEQAEIVRCLTQDFDLPLAVIAKYDTKHPILQNIDEDTLEALTVNGTIAMLINAGPFQDELVELTRTAGLPLLGSSANISGTGTSIPLVPMHFLNC